jgi:hypothetical protein
MNRLLAALRPAAFPPVHAPVHAAVHGPARAAAVSAASKATEAQAPDGTGLEAPGACGWFDSSHALQHGLCVTEHASADAVAAHLPLDDWLQLHLGGWPGLRAAGLPSH